MTTSSATRKQLDSTLRKTLEREVLRARRISESASRAALEGLGVYSDRRPEHLDASRRALRKGLRAKWKQLGGDHELLIAACAYEQWHRLLFARILAENNLLLHPKYGVPVTLADCEELAVELGDPDGWSIAGQFAAEILPGIFRLDDPCVRLRLAPESRHALEQILDGLPPAVFVADDVLGWVYQYWQKDQKDEINASERKIGGADLGPVTQLFTENYMVRFLLENSLGAWWAARHPDSPLIESFEYLRFGDNGSPASGSFDGWPDRVAEVTVMDPCCGSGHFLVEAFSMLWQMRAEEDYLSVVDAQDAVLRDSLFGLEIDPRCVEIAMFGVVLQAWKAGGGWRQLPVPNIACSGIPAKTPVEEWVALADGDPCTEKTLRCLHYLFRHADTLGSLVDPTCVTEESDSGYKSRRNDVGWVALRKLLSPLLMCETDDSAAKVLGADTAVIADAVELLARTYTLVVTNPPYLGRGKQGLVLREHLEQYFGSGRQDLSTAFLLRATNLLHEGGALSFVTPHNWFIQPAYETLRTFMLSCGRLAVAAILGEEGFESFGIRGPRTVLLTWEAGQRGALGGWSIDVSSPPGKAQILIPEKIERLKTLDLTYSTSIEHLERPTRRILFDVDSRNETLRAYAMSYQGLKSGDDPRHRRFFWEMPEAGNLWRPAQGGPLAANLSGDHYLLRWEHDGADLARLQGLGAWKQRGIAVGRTRSLVVSDYEGAAFFSEIAAIIPKDASSFKAIRAFAYSGELERLVRQIDRATILSNDTFLDVPFCLNEWQRIDDGAADSDKSRSPSERSSEGRPESSAAPLHVAVARLVGYRWPGRIGTDDLDEFADADGIVCLPSVAGEPPAADRVRQLLAAAFGHAWSPGKVRELLERAGSKKQNLADWLRDEFFRQHCALFQNRPFVWHIWDGLRDGFCALVNYHRLDHRTLEKLTYTYLGQDWVERQRAGVRDKVARAEERLTAALALRGKLEAILEGEKPYDIYVRWKEPYEQPIGWDPDLNDGVRLNARPFVEAAVLRAPFNIHWRKDRGKNPDGSARENDKYFTLGEKHEARQRAGLA